MATRKRLQKPSAFAKVVDIAKTGTRSIRELASDADIPPETLRRWVAGSEPAAFADLERLAKALGLRITLESVA